MTDIHLLVLRVKWGLQWVDRGQSGEYVTFLRVRVLLVQQLFNKLLIQFLLLAGHCTMD